MQIRLHDTMESLYKSIGMDVLPDEYLPDDYTGPSAGPLQQIIRTYTVAELLYAAFYYTVFTSGLYLDFVHNVTKL